MLITCTWLDQRKFGDIIPVSLRGRDIRQRRIAGLPDYPEQELLLN